MTKLIARSDIWVGQVMVDFSYRVRVQQLLELLVVIIHYEKEIES